MKYPTLPLLLLALGGCGSPANDSSSAIEANFVTPDADEAWLDLEDMQGAQHDLRAALADGREVALVFWQTWCPTCLTEAPEVEEASRTRAEETAFFGVVTGPDDLVDDEKVTSTARALGLTYPQVRDRDADLARRFDVQGTPTIVVIDPGGRISFRGHRLPESWATSESSTSR